MGRYCDRIRKPLRLYALTELAITGLALASPWALRTADGIYIGLCRSWQPGPGWLIAGQIVISTCILLVPTLLMGSTLPLLGRFVASVEKDAGPLVGRLYALNTLGAAAGCFLAGFVLIKVIGVMGTLRFAAVLNLLVALGGYVMHRVSLRDTGETAVSASPLPIPVALGRGRDTGLALLGAGFFLSGLVSIGYELLWMRSIVHTAGAFTFVFSAVLTVYLAGNVIGAAIGSRIIRSVKNPAGLSAVLLSGLGACGVLYLPWLNLCNYHLMPWLLGPLDESAWYKPMPWNLLCPLIRSTVLFLVPSMVMGIGFPIMLQAWVDRAHRIGWSTGTAYGVNTWGAVAGGVVTGFLLIPLLGLQVTILALGIAAVWVGTLMWLYFVRPVAGRRWRRWLLPLAAVFVTVQSTRLPGDLFVKTVALSRWMRDCEVLDIKEGINTTVSVHRDPRTNALYLCTSGCRVAGTSREYRGDQKMLGHLPVLLNKDAQSVLSVGFGSGESTACLSTHGVERVDCVEIAPELVKVSLTYFNGLNLGDELDEKVHMIYQDAKNYLRLTDRRYDAIVNDCTSMRGMAENASLYTKEYFESARDHLTDNGLFMSWLDTYASECHEAVQSVIGTILEVFPYVTLWYPTTEPGPYFVIVGSKRPQSFSPRHIDSELAKPAVRESLAQIGCRDSVDVLSCYVADEGDLRQYVTAHLTNSDYFPAVEFCTEPEPGNFYALRQFFTTIRSDSACEHVDWAGIGESEKASWLGRFEKAHQVATHIFLAESSPDYLETLRHAMSGLVVIGDHHALLVLKQTAEHALLEQGLKAVKAGDASRAMHLARSVVEMDPDSAQAWVLRSQAERAAGNLPLAQAAARTAFELAPEDLGVQFNLWSMLVSANDAAGVAAILRAGMQAMEEKSNPAVRDKMEAPRP